MFPYETLKIIITSTSQNTQFIEGYPEYEWDG